MYPSMHRASRRNEPRSSHVTWLIAIFCTPKNTKKSTNDTEVEGKRLLAVYLLMCHLIKYALGPSIN